MGFFKRWTRWAVFPLVLVAVACLATGVWGGLVRLYWSLAPVSAFSVDWVTFHGPLMVCGFLGTLIGVERAAAVRRWWAYPGPVLSAAGGVCLIAGVLGPTAPRLFLLGSLCLLLVTAGLWVRHASSDLLVMSAGAALWSVGNLLWLQGRPIHQVVFWWAGFLLLTIVGERLELSRFLQPTRTQMGSVLLVIAGFVAGLFAMTFWHETGQRLAGLAIAALAAWLLRHDVARRVVRKPGAPRFTAVCLLIGYVWLAAAGLATAYYSPLPSYGYVYDATLHAFFLGFVVSMIFGHAPIILPAALNVPLPFRPGFYVPVLVLHLGLLLRVTGDMAVDPQLHGWGGTFGAVALLLFILNTVAAAFHELVSRRRDRLSEVRKTNVGGTHRL
jgi:hypothetical protein